MPKKEQQISNKENYILRTANIIKDKLSFEQFQDHFENEEKLINYVDKVYKKIDNYQTLDVSRLSEQLANYVINEVKAVERSNQNIFTSGKKIDLRTYEQEIRDEKIRDEERRKYFERPEVQAKIQQEVKASLDEERLRIERLKSSRKKGGVSSESLNKGNTPQESRLSKKLRTEEKNRVEQAKLKKESALKRLIESRKAKYPLTQPSK